MALMTPLEAPSSAELLHIPQEVTARGRLAALIRTSLITEFPASGSCAEALLTPDEAADLLLSAASPWQRHVWWSAEVISLLEEAVRSRRPVTTGYILSRLRSLDLPQQHISSLGEMFPLSHLVSCSLASNALSEVRGGDLPRSLRSLQLYGNPLGGSLAALLTSCPPLHSLGIGRIQLTDQHLPELTSLLSSCLPSLLVLDISDNHICDLARITALVTGADSIRSISLSGNPAFLASGYYRHFLSGAGRLKLLDGLELAEIRAADLQQQQEQQQLPPQPPDQAASKKNRSGKKPAVNKSCRRSSPALDPSRFEPSVTSALIRITGAVYLPFVPKDQWPGQEVCVVFQWAGFKADASSPDTDTDSSGGLCPLEALLLEKSDVTTLEMPLEWHCTDLRPLRDAMLQYLRAEVVRREKWTPPNKPKKEKRKEPTKGIEGQKKTNKGGKGNKKSDNEGGGSKTKDFADRDGSSSKKQGPAGVPEDEVVRPPPEFSLGSVLLPVRPLLRPGGRLQLQGITSSTGTPATISHTHWMEAVSNIQEEKKERKAAMKKAEKEEKTNKNKKMSASVQSGSGRRKAKPPKPVIQCFFSVELYRTPLPDFEENYISHLPIDDLE